MHEEIVNFSREGEVADDSAFIRTRQRLTHDIHNEMRDRGFVPILDIDTHWSTEYIVGSDKPKYKFKLTVYGVFLGGQDCKDRAMDGGKIIKTA